MALDNAVALFISADFEETWQIFVLIFALEKEFEVLLIRVVERDPSTAGWTSDRVLNRGLEARFD